MAVSYIQNKGGGGLFSRLLPQVLSMAGNAIGGPVGGQLGSMIGNAATGNNSGLSAQIIGGIGQNGGNQTPPQTQFPSPQGTDWGDYKNYTSWLNLMGR